MADSVSKSSNTENETAAAELKQVESQLVSLNFVLKNTQSEVIKLQKTLARSQTHQEESDKKLAKLEADLGRFHVNQKEDEGFRSRYILYQLVTIAICLILFFVIHSLMPHPAAQAPAPAAQHESTTSTNESTGFGTSNATSASGNP